MFFDHFCYYDDVLFLSNGYSDGRDEKYTSKQIYNQIGFVGNGREGEKI